MLQKIRFAMLSVTLLMIGLSAAGASAEDHTAGWQFSKIIEFKHEALDKSKTQYRSVFLDEAVYAKAREDLADLRIVDAEGRFIPFYMESGFTENSEKATVYSAQMITSIQKKQDTLIDYFIKPLQQNVDIQGNLLKVTLPKMSFLKFVEVFGGYDGNQWELLGKYTLYNTEQLEKNSIELGRIYKYNYYRLRIIDNVEKIAFPELELVHNEQESRLAVYTKTFTPQYKAVEEGRQTLLTIQNDQRLKIKKLSLDVESNFRRTYDLMDSTDVHIPFIGEKELYNLKFKDIQIQNKSIVLPASNASQQIVLKINNEDNAPLQIKQVNVEYDIHRLVFEDSGSETYQLFYGNPDAIKPKYEIEAFKSHIEKENPALALLGKSVELNDVTKPVINKSAWYQSKMTFNAVIGFVSLLLIVFLIQKLRKS